MLFLIKRIFRKKKTEDVKDGGENVFVLIDRLRGRIERLRGKSLFIRAVDTGSCNACEVEISNLNNPYYDMERFGVKFVASPKHADVLMVTGCVTRNMLRALLKAYENTPSPKFVITVGDCAKDGGLFKDSYAVFGPVSKHIPALIHIKGCPPEPADMLKGLEKLLEIMEDPDYIRQSEVI